MINKDLKKVNKVLLAFCEKHKDDIAYDDLVNFNNLWHKIHNDLQTGDKET